MRLNSKMRGAEKRAPAMSVLLTSAAFVGVFLVALWVLSGPTGGSGYSSNIAKTMSVNTLEEDKVETKTTNLPTSQENVDASSDSESTDEILVVEPSSKADKSAGDALTEFENSELAFSDSEKSEGTETDVGKSVEDENRTDPDSDLEETPQKTSTTDTAELSVETEEAPTSTLLSQGKESKEEKIQEVIQDTGTVEEEDIVDEKPSLEPETTEEKAATLGGLERVEVTDDGNYKWQLCSFNGAQDYIPCLDNNKTIKTLRSTKHFEHRERHCPVGNDLPTCLVPLPEGYQQRVDWPTSRDKVWHANVPHDKLVTYKQDQNWVKKQGDYLVFPGGGTQFKNGALQYISTIEKTWEDITFGKHVRTVLDVGCGVASFGGYMFDKDAIVMSFAPKDEHEAQVQMALERGIPGILSVMGTKRLIFPSNVFDVVHCARCRVPWHSDGGKLLLELNRLLRPGGFFVWSATPVYRTNDPSEVELWKATKKVADAMCWDLLVRTKAAADTGIGMAIFQKPTDNTCYDKRKVDEPPMCPIDDKPDAAWYVDMNSCLHRIPTGEKVRATYWPEDWPARLETTPEWLSSIPKGVYGKPAYEEFVSDTAHWQNVVTKSYLKDLGIQWDHVRNVLDMKAGYGGFAAALSTQPVWVMNVVPTDEPDTLPIIYDRGLFGLYHDWCEALSTYPRTYDLLHADRVFASVENRCSILTTVIEMDRILRPTGWAIFRDKEETIGEIQEIIKSLHWTVKYSYVEGTQQFLAAQKEFWRPET
ncbi:unnamed protein product [Calypogeia fissa]